MKKLLLTFLFFCTTTAYAANEPVFEETDGDDHHNKTHTSFSFNADCDPWGAEDERHQSPPYAGVGEETWNVDYNGHGWKRYAATFGLEKVIARFPHRPSSTLEGPFLIASSSSGSVSYTFQGKCPPKGQIEPISCFTEICARYSEYPFSLFGHHIQETSDGNWTMDYVAHDCLNDMIHKGHTTVTPFNIYTIQCIKPSGSLDFFQYFVENFSIKCNCDCNY